MVKDVVFGPAAVRPHLAQISRCLLGHVDLIDRDNVVGGAEHVHLLCGEDELLAVRQHHVVPRVHLLRQAGLVPQNAAL